MEAATSPTPTRRRRFSPWFLRMSGGIVALALVLAFWNSVIRPHTEHRRLYDQARGRIEHLARMRPADVSRGEWQYVVGWTINAHGNCASHPSFVYRDAFGRFVAELERRIEQGPVTMATIDWIWDQYEQVSRYGPTYSESYRPTHPDRLQEAAYFTWAGVNVP